MMDFDKDQQSEEFFDDLRAGNKMLCPCCKRYAQVYRRHLHTSVALQLIILHKRGGADKYVHVRELVTDNMSGAGDFTKAKYWGLIQEAPIQEDGKKSSGYWKLTMDGVMFVKGLHAIRKTLLVYDDQVIGSEGGVIYINECLGNKFNYQQMMEAV